MTYEQLLNKLNGERSQKFAEGQSRIINDPSLKFLGVNTPALRKTAKEFYDSEQIFTFPDEYYEVAFIKLAVASRFTYDKLIARLDGILPLITNWALCDSAFKPACIKRNKADFAQYIKKYIRSSGEFKQRFALITLLSFYVEEQWLPLIKECVEACDSSEYYVMMGAAWLLAEVLAKYYEQGVGILTTADIDKRTKNKAIQKARESFRLSPEQKQFLKTLKA